jgi:predicted nucleotide-binding protein
VEKLEQHAEDASYAVVLLTADDVGGLAGSTTMRPRARQNVVLELGLFTGLLGRDKIAVLYESDVEIPSDIAGLEYLALDGDWEKQLVRELRAAGWDFSLDRIVG